MSKKDYYDALGVSKSASESEIKTAYRKLAMQYHPDKNQGNKDTEAKFREVTEAYEVLSDSSKRAKYDKFGHASSDSGFGGGGGGFDFDFGGGGDFGDIFEQFFGGGGSSRGGSKARTAGQDGSDLRYDLQITLEESFSGTIKKIVFKTFVKCEPCKGSGGKNGSKAVNCKSCGGAGKVRRQQGFFVVESTCSSCNGSGSVISEKCTTCFGDGRIPKEKNIEVKVPQGIMEGQKIKLAGEGEAGLRGGSTGDLFIFVSVKKHQFFSRDENNLICEVSIPFVDAVLGDSIKIPVFGGKEAEIVIKAGTQSGDIAKVSGFGMPILNTSRFGDLKVKINIETPVSISQEQKNLLIKFKELSSGKNNPKSETFFDKIRKMF